MEHKDMKDGEIPKNITAITSKKFLKLSITIVFYMPWILHTNYVT